jgi:hypothetical protein
VLLLRFLCVKATITIASFFSFYNPANRARETCTDYISFSLVSLFYGSAQADDCTEHMLELGSDDIIVEVQSHCYSVIEDKLETQFFPSFSQQRERESFKITKKLQPNFEFCF